MRSNRSRGFLKVTKKAIAIDDRLMITRKHVKNLKLTWSFEEKLSGAYIVRLSFHLKDGVDEHRKKK